MHATWSSIFLAAIPELSESDRKSQILKHQPNVGARLHFQTHVCACITFWPLTVQSAHPPVYTGKMHGVAMAPYRCEIPTYRNRPLGKLRAI
jgi:hypothetical protein